VAKLVGSPSINLIEAVRENGTAHVRNSPIKIPVDGAGADLPQEFILGVRPEDIQPNPKGEYGGEIVLIEPLGVETVIHIHSGERTIQSLVPGRTSHQIGESVKYDIIRDRLHFFDKNGKRV
jgi:multiple sugar transport system ATP-binding protein